LKAVEIKHTRAPKTTASTYIGKHVVGDWGEQN